MGIVIGFAEAHDRASAGSRAAKAVNLSEVTPPSRATGVDRIADHLSAGMLSRCHHLETAGARTRTSDAKASFEGQRSITSRKERKSAIEDVLGQIVLKCKDNLALDGKKSLGHAVPMVDSDEKALFEQEFTARVRSARIATGKKQWQVAELLGIPQDKYKQYEGRSLLPHYLVGRFCLICNVDPVWLMTGKGKKPLQPPHIVETERAPVPKPKRQKRSKAA